MRHSWKGFARSAVLSILFGTASIAAADVIEVESCLGANCTPSSSSLVYLDGSSSSSTFTYGGLPPVIAANITPADDLFSWSSGPLSLTAGPTFSEIYPSYYSLQTGSATTPAGYFIEGLTLSVTANDSAGLAGVIELTALQSITNPVPGNTFAFGSSDLDYQCSSNSAGSLSVAFTGGGNPAGGVFTGLPCSTGVTSDTFGPVTGYPPLANDVLTGELTFNFSAHSGVPESIGVFDASGVFTSTTRRQVLLRRHLSLRALFCLAPDCSVLQGL